MVNRVLVGVRSEHDDELTGLPPKTVTQIRRFFSLTVLACTVSAGK